MSSNASSVPGIGTRRGFLSELDRLLLELFMAGCAHDWARLAPIARAYYAAGGPAQQLRAMARHVLTVGGYGPCLKVILTLHNDDLLGPLTEGKVSGPPGNAFELVYGDIALAVRKKLHDADPVLGEWIRLHLYGDVYSSPGIDLRMKQLALCGFLGEADMPDQLFGHALAAFRFGATREQVEEAVDLAYESMKSEAKTAAHKEAFKIIDMAHHKFLRLNLPSEACSPPFVLTGPGTVELPSLFTGMSMAEEDAADSLAQSGSPAEKMPSLSAPPRPLMAWEQAAALVKKQ